MRHLLYRPAIRPVAPVPLRVACLCHPSSSMPIVAGTTAATTAAAAAAAAASERSRSCHHLVSSSSPLFSTRRPRRRFAAATSRLHVSPFPSSCLPDPPRPPGMRVSCQCGSVAFDTSAAAPLAVYHCHCTECQKQTSSAFGTSAIFPAAGIFPLSPALRDQLALYVRPGSRVKSGRDMDCYFCKTCGSRVMHRIRDQGGTERDTVSIKGGLVG